MNKELREKTAEWMSLERKTLEQRRIADQFYDTELMNLIVSEYITNNQKAVREPVEYLVISVGTSYEPLALNISLLKPKKILLLYTDKSEATLDKVVNYCKLRPQDYEKRKVNSVDPMEIYREIKSSYLEWKKPDRMYIDFTGGTKAMSTACALAGALIDVQMIYVSTNDYLTDFRKPDPGSERLSYVENPLAVFGDLEVDKALELMSRCNYAGAVEKLSVLKEQIPDPAVRQQLEFLYTLALTYENWDALDFIPAYQWIQRLYSQLRRDSKLHPDYLLMDHIEQVAAQQACLEQLSKIPTLQEQKRREDILQSSDIIHSLMFTMLQNASIREQQEKYDMATLLLYRLLEMIEQRRLIHYNIYASAPEYQNINYSIVHCLEYEGKQPPDQLQLLKQRVQEFKLQMFRNADSYLPQQIALLDGFIILAALGDPITEETEAASGRTDKRGRTGSKGNISRINNSSKTSRTRIVMNTAQSPTAFSTGGFTEKQSENSHITSNNAAATLQLNRDHGSLNILRRIRSMVYLRNNSIFAHGLGPVSKEDFTKFRDFVTGMFRKFCQIENIDYDAARQVVSYIQVTKNADSISGWNE